MRGITVHGDEPGTPKSDGVVGIARERGGPHDPAWSAAAAAARWGTLADRFWSRVTRGDGCWTWQGRKDRDGYGRLEALGLSHAKAHRVAWHLVNGPVPAGMVVCHRCDTPGCVRAEPGGTGHLFVASQRENIRDSLAKGRHGSQKQAGKKRGPYRNQAAV
jgi:hypothetical protein